MQQGVNVVIQEISLVFWWLKQEKSMFLTSITDIWNINNPLFTGHLRAAE